MEQCHNDISHSKNILQITPMTSGNLDRVSSRNSSLRTTYSLAMPTNTVLAYAIGYPKLHDSLISKTYSINVCAMFVENRLKHAVR